MWFSRGLLKQNNGIKQCLNTTLGYKYLIYINQ